MKHNLPGLNSEDPDCCSKTANNNTLGAKRNSSSPLGRKGQSYSMIDKKTHACTQESSSQLQAQPIFNSFNHLKSEIIVVFVDSAVKCTITAALFEGSLNSMFSDFTYTSAFIKDV